MCYIADVVIGNINCAKILGEYLFSPQPPLSAGWVVLVAFAWAQRRGRLGHHTRQPALLSQKRRAWWNDLKSLDRRQNMATDNLIHGLLLHVVAGGEHNDHIQTG